MTPVRAGLLSLVLALAPLPAFASVPVDRVETNRLSFLFPSTQADLNEQLQNLFEDTGIEVFILIVPALDGRTAQETAQAQPLWRRPGEQVLLLIGLDDRVVRIETEGPRSARADAVWARLIETEMLPGLRAQQQGKAVRRGVNALDRELRGQPPEPSLVLRGYPAALLNTLFVLCAGFLAAVGFDRMSRERLWRARW